MIETKTNIFGYVKIRQKQGKITFLFNIDVNWMEYVFDDKF